jgi:hypothetical protein
MKLERTRLRCAGNAVDLGLHLALAKVGDDATRVIVDKYIGSLCRGHLFHKRVGFYGWDSYLEIAVQHTLLVKVRHTLRDLVYHFQRVDSCGISVAQALQVLDEASPRIILADLFKRSQCQTNNR